MPRSTYQRLLSLIGKLAVLLIVGFLVLPVAVVTPATTPGMDNGSVTVRNTRMGPAPRLSAAFWQF